MIKLKAWNEEKKMMSHSYTPEELRKEKNINALLPTHKLKWLRFLEVSDENGEDLYEGDIVRVTSKGGKTDVGCLFYMSPTWKIRSLTKAISYDLIDWGYSERLSGVVKIGNCYANPELMRRSNDEM